MCQQGVRWFQHFDLDPESLVSRDVHVPQVTEENIEKPEGQISPRVHISERNVEQGDDVFCGFSLCCRRRRPSWKQCSRCHGSASTNHRGNCGSPFAACPFLCAASGGKETLRTSGSETSKKASKVPRPEILQESVPQERAQPQCHGASDVGRERRGGELDSIPTNAKMYR